MMKATLIGFVFAVLIVGTQALPLQAQEADSEPAIRNITNINYGVPYRRGITVLMNRMPDLGYQVESKNWKAAKFISEDRIIPLVRNMRNAIPRPEMRAYIGIINFEQAMTDFVSALDTADEKVITEKFSILESYLRGMQFQRGRM